MMNAKITVAFYDELSVLAAKPEREIIRIEATEVSSAACDAMTIMP